MTETTIEVTIQPQTNETFEVTPAAPLPSASNGHEPSSDTSDISPAPLLRGQHRPSPIGPPIPNHPLAPFIGAFNDEPLWDALQEEIRKYHQQMNEQPDEDD